LQVSVVSLRLGAVAGWLLEAEASLPEAVTPAAESAAVREARSDVPLLEAEASLPEAVPPAAEAVAVWEAHSDVPLLEAEASLPEAVIPAAGAVAVREAHSGVRLLEAEASAPEVPPVAEAVVVREAHSAELEWQAEEQYSAAARPVVHRQQSAEHVGDGPYPRREPENSEPAHLGASPGLWLLEEGDRDSAPARAAAGRKELEPEEERCAPRRAYSIRWLADAQLGMRCLP